MHRLKWGKTTKFGFLRRSSGYADQVVLYARMKICFVLNVDELNEEKN